MNIGKILLAALLGGLAFQAWTFASWMALKLHEPTMRGFTNEAEVNAAIMAGAPEPGMYFVPFHDHSDNSKEANEAAMKKFRDGPFMFASVRPGTKEFSMGRTLACGFIVNLAAGLLAAILLAAAAPNLNYLGRALFVMVLGLFSAIVAHVPNIIWWEFGKDFVFINMLDLVLGWFLAGLVMAALIKPSAPAEPAPAAAGAAAGAGAE